jgi:hypothetical protein
LQVKTAVEKNQTRGMQSGLVLVMFFDGQYSWCSPCAVDGATLSPAAMQKLRIVTLGISGGRSHEAVSRRPPISLYTIIARTHMYTYAARVWDLSIVPRAIFCRPVPTPTLRFATCSSVRRITVAVTPLPDADWGPPPPPPPARAGILPFAKHFSELWNAKKRVQQFVEAVKRAEVEWKRAGGCMLRKTKRKKIIKAGTGTAGVPQVRATCFDELRSIRVQDELTPPFRDALPISKTRV